MIELKQTQEFKTAFTKIISKVIIGRQYYHFENFLRFFSKKDLEALFNYLSNSSKEDLQKLANNELILIQINKLKQSVIPDLSRAVKAVKRVRELEQKQKERKIKLKKEQEIKVKKENDNWLKESKSLAAQLKLTTEQRQLLKTLIDE